MKFTPRGLLFIAFFIIGAAIYVGSSLKVRAEEMTDSVPHSYIVVLKDQALPSQKSTQGAVNTLEAAHKFKKSRVFENSFDGFSATLTPEQVSALKNDPRVQYVTENRYVRVTETHGLTGTYFDNADFTGTTFVRTDPTIHFDWGTEAPVEIDAETFSVRWEGQVQPRYSQIYRFYAKTDDGVRLWVDNKLIIDSWGDQAVTEKSGTIKLQANRKYTIRMDYFDNTVHAVAQLRWSSRSQPKQIIPSNRLYPVAANPSPTPTPSTSPSPTPSPTEVPTPSPSEDPVPTPVVSEIIPNGVLRIGLPTSDNKGAGIGVAIIDTGIDMYHPDLTQNIAASVNCIDSTQPVTDMHGHGTHVAGVVAAAKNNFGIVGVAPEAKLIAVKVMDDNGVGTWESVICGIDWVTENATTYTIKVANMSFAGGGGSDNNCGYTNNDPVHMAICRSRNAGVTYIAAAANSGADASWYIPASYEDAVITVSALADSDGLPGGLGGGTGMGNDDTFAGFSNYGSVVDLGAPGTSVYSTAKNGGYTYMSGTSMAAPHVAGAAALYLAKYPWSYWVDVKNHLQATGEKVGEGHTDPFGLHPEPVVLTKDL